MSPDNKCFTPVGVAWCILTGGMLLGSSHLDPAEVSAQVEIDGGTLDVARFEAVDLDLSGVITNSATVSFTDENRSSYSDVSGGVSVTFQRD